MSELKEIFKDTFTNWRFGGWPESKSGPGSTYEATESIRQQIKKLVKEKQIKSVVDVPCGDFNWMKDIVYSFETYTGCDIVSELIEENKKYSNQIINFVELDVTKNQIPSADLLIVRDLIGHLSLEDGNKVIQNILNSGCKYLLSTTWYNLQDKNYNETHKNIDNEVTLAAQWERGASAFYPVNLMAAPFNFPEPDFFIEENAKVDNYENGVRKILGFWDIGKLKTVLQTNKTVTPNLTVVTGLWNIGRQGRDFSHYIHNFQKFLEIPVNMFIYVPKELEYLVWQKRNTKNTIVRIFELEDIKNNFYSPFWEKTQEIRNSPEWLNQTGENGWLTNSPQAVNEWYNPIVQSKMFMLHDAKILNPFNTDYFLWLDAGITNTVNPSCLINDRALDQVTEHMDSFLFLSYPYQANNEIHGFNFDVINRTAGEKVTYVCRGGLFGGHKDVISKANETYYHLLNETLSRGCMGTEESIFSIMAHKEPHFYKRYSLDENGLIIKFIQALLEKTVKLEEVKTISYNSPKGFYNKAKDKTSLYMLGFNFPEQMQETLKSFEEHPEWLERPRKILINNSNNKDSIEKYDELCKKYGFEHIITGENLGINGGRYLAAEHFDSSDSSYYFFFEDDMMLHNKELKFCRNGFRTYVHGLYDKVHHIVAREQFDFLKLSYTEVYMDNNIQVSWYNVPQSVRNEIWPEYNQLPVSGLDPNAPRTIFKHINEFQGLSYISGQIYYANWPMIVSRNGNKKMFLETKWARPYEQTWMSYMFQETLKENLNPGILLASPINHNRISHYKPEERREN
jgi:hypothetical protein